MTPAQFRAAVQKAQRDQKRAVDKYNSEVRKHNAAVKKAIDNYNRAVRNYNTKARARNRDVENQRRRLRQEMARLSSRPSTTFIQYRQSTTTFVETYERADASLSASPGSVADQRFLDLVSDEAANSAYLASALEGDGDTENVYADSDMRAPSLEAELGHFGTDLVQRWIGALYALSPMNPDAARHFCTSSREVVISMLDQAAPDDEVMANEPGCQLTESGAVTRRSKVSYLLRRHGVTSRGVTDAVAEDVENLLSLFATFNKGTHGHAGRFGLTELSAIRTRVEEAVRFVYTVVSVPA